ncbi:MAG: NHL repeat-containing protein [Proteobacteria bacterium]|nr:NHL repeat-containing protein [Pseudomonadota bacterium]
MPVTFSQNLHLIRLLTILSLSTTCFVTCRSNLNVTLASRNVSGACASASSKGKSSCDAASSLAWKEVSPHTSTSVTATWTKSTANKLAKQKIQFYQDSKCELVIGDRSDLTSTDIQSKSFTGENGKFYTFKVISVDSKANETISDCSPSMKIVTKTIDSTPPTISSISSQSTSINSATSAIAFTIGDSKNSLSCSDSYLRLESSDNSLVLAGGVVWSGTYPSCSAVVTPVTNAVGTVALTFVVTDSVGGTASSTFNLVISSAFALGQVSTSINANLERGVNNPKAAIVAGGKLFVAELGTSRVLVWNTVPTSSSEPPSFVLGQASLTSYVGCTSTSTGMCYPTALYSDGVRLFVADSLNNRVLVWNSLPTSSGQAASFALGQPDLVSNSSNNGGVSASSLYSPIGISVVGTKLFVSDSNNARVLVWNSIPTTSGQAADFVLGQSNFTSNTANSGGISGSSLYTPSGIYSDGTKLYVADPPNNRVLVWNTIPTVTAQSASFALGQTNLTSNTAATAATGMISPSGVTSDGSKLFVTDTGNFRVLVWNSLPTASGAAANFALGQTNLTTSTSNQGTAATGSVLWSPSEVFSDGLKLYVADTRNNRILVWNSIPTTSGQPANFAIGQPNLTEVAYLNPGITGSSMCLPYGIQNTGSKLFVSDMQNHRVLVWNTLPSSSGQSADFAIGQASLTAMTHVDGGTTSTSLSAPVASYSSGGKLYIADQNNSRVLGWNSIPTSFGQAADFVLGQSNFTNSTQNNGGRTGSTMWAPADVSGDGTRLFVADLLNHRVLVWNALPSSTAQAANFALGQSNLTNGINNAGGLSGSSLKTPTSVFSNGTKLFVADSNNNRVLVWNSMPTVSGQAASFALGQPNLTSNTSNNGGISASTLSIPSFVYSDGTKLFVSDSNNNRVLVWNTLPTSSGQAADTVIGQPNFTASAAGLSATNLSYPVGLVVAGGKLYISDTGNNRVLVVPTP